MGNIVKLSSCERDLLVTCGMRAEATMAECAKISGHSIHKIRYALDRLMSTGAVRQIWVVDIYRLGWHRFVFYCSLEGCTPQRRQTFIDAARQSRFIAYLCEVAGDYEYEFSLIAQDPAAALQELSRLVAISGVSFFNKELAIRTKISLFPRKYLSSKRPRVSKIEYGSTQERFVADALDHALLREVSVQGRQSLQEIAMQLKEPRSTIERRFRRLCDEKVIAGSMFSTKPSIYGARTYKLLLLSRSLGDDTAILLGRFAERHPHCTYVHQLFGTWDYEVGIEAAQYSDVTSLRSSLSELLGPRVLDIRMLERGNILKYHSYPFEESGTKRQSSR